MLTCLGSQIHIYVRMPGKLFATRFSILNLDCVHFVVIHLTSCLTAIKNHAIKYCTTAYERNG